MASEKDLQSACEKLLIVKGYQRRQGIAFRPEHSDLGETPEEFVERALIDRLHMVNRNVGSGTRILIDRLLAGRCPDGYLNQARTHHATAAAIAQGRADWGMTLDTVAAGAGLGFLFVQDEAYDLLVREERADRPAVMALLGILAEPGFKQDLAGMGFSV